LTSVAFLAVILVGCEPADPPEPPDLAEDAPAGEEVAIGELPHRGVLAIEGVTVVSTETEGTHPDRTVVIRDGRISEVGLAGEVVIPDEAVRIDGQSRYLMPGMAEMHGHLPGGGAEPELVQRILFLYVANGVTLVRGMQGHPDQLTVRDDIADGRLLGPRLLVSSPAQGWGSAPDADEAPARAREFARAGYDLIKVGEGVSADAYRALVETARDEGLPVAGHVPDHVGLFGALDAGQVTIDHLDNYVEELIPEEERTELAALWGVAQAAHLADEERIPELVSATVEAGTPQVPTMALWENFFGDRTGEELRDALPEVRYMPRETVDGWVDGLASLKETIGALEGGLRVVELRREIFRALHDGGAPFLMGTDSPQLFSVPGFSNHREMALWAELGMTPWEIIHAGSWAVAEHLGELDRFGAVREGHRADLILLEANPLDDVGNVERRAGVIVDGRWLPEEEIQRRLAALAW
jgi:imidazolonepropionase-like amidohydrolase